MSKPKMDIIINRKGESSKIRRPRQTREYRASIEQLLIVDQNLLNYFDDSNQ